jgi:two-component system, cell cycle sensor histidine kinase and response regulator CckA
MDASNPLFQGDRSAQSADRFLDSIIENIPHMIFVKEAQELRFVRFNKAGEELLGYSRFELIGKNDYDFFPKDEADFFVSRDRAVLANGSLLEIPEEPIHTRHKGKRFLHTKKIPIFDAQGKPLYLLGISEDITDRRRMQQAESELHQHRHLESIGRLAGGVAHDFNNLLTGIMGVVEELRLSPETPDVHRADLDEILKAGERAGALTRQLLAFGRRQMTMPRVIDVNDVLRGIEPFAVRLIGANIALKFHLGSDACYCRMDPVQLEQIILNAVLNSRDAMPEGGKVSVSTRCRDVIAEDSVANLPEGRYAEIVIADTGRGMDDETRRHAFEPFYTTKANDKGSGLGLATVYGIVKQNNGDVMLQSELGKGTTLSIWLPVAQEAPSTTNVAVAPVLAHGVETILVAEDEQIVRRTVVRTLEKAGYKVLPAQDGREALTLAQQHTGVLHLLLTDVIMPGLNGRQLATHVMQNHPETKVLYMSGYTEDIVASRDILQSNIAFLEKTFTAEKLLTKVREVLDRPVAPSTLHAS